MGVQGRGWMSWKTHKGKGCKEEDKHNKGLGGGDACLHVPKDTRLGEEFEGT